MKRAPHIISSKRVYVEYELNKFVWLIQNNQIAKQQIVEINMTTTKPIMYKLETGQWYEGKELANTQKEMWQRANNRYLDSIKDKQ